MKVVLSQNNSNTNKKIIYSNVIKVTWNF